MIKLIKCASGAGLSCINFDDEKEFIHVSSKPNGIEVQTKSDFKVYTTEKGISINQQMDTLRRLHYLRSTNTIKNVDDIVPVLIETIEVITNRKVMEVR